jgi:hypothetical protein
MKESVDNLDLCMICGKPTQKNPFYTGDNPICSQECLYEWDEDHPNLDTEEDDKT